MPIEGIVRDPPLILVNTPKQPIQVRKPCRYRFLKEDDQKSSKII